VDFVTNEIAGRAKVIVPDLPGFGSNKILASEPFGLIDLLIIVAEILDKEDCPTAVIAGMSMGGYVALSFAAALCPERMAGLGLIATQAGADSDEGRRGPPVHESNALFKDGTGSGDCRSDAKTFCVKKSL